MKTRVLFLHSATRPPLGADTWIHTLIMRHLDRSQHEVHVACAPGPTSQPTPTLEAVRAIADLHVHEINLGPELFARSKMGRLRAAIDTTPAIWNMASLVSYVRKHEIQIVHTSDRPRDALASAVLAKITGAKCIIHVHVTYGDWMNRMLRWSMGRADALIGVSNFVARSLVQGGGYSAAKTHSVLNAIDLERWNADVDRLDARRELGIAPDAPLLICVARLFPAKGQDKIVHALAQLRTEFPGMKALIVGQDYPPGTHYSEELKALAEKLGVAGSLVFTGLRKDVARLIASADLLVMPSFEEPFGLVYAEAMAMRRPVVAYDDGGTPEVVDHGKSGLLSPRSDDSALSKNIATLIRNPELRREMGEYGRKQAETRFHPARLAEDVARVYTEVLRGTRA
ncbi:MAG: glycosyltransferase family 4 protein [Polyangiaceae bacterium]